MVNRNTGALSRLHHVRNKTTSHGADSGHKAPTTLQSLPCHRPFLSRSVDPAIFGPCYQGRASLRNTTRWLSAAFERSFAIVESAKKNHGSPIARISADTTFSENKSLFYKAASHWKVCTLIRSTGYRPLHSFRFSWLDESQPVS